MADQNNVLQSLLDSLQNSNQAVEQQLSPYRAGVEKALKKGGESHAAEALAQGVPSTHIEQQAGLSPISLTGAMGSQGMGYNNQPQQPNPKEVLAQLVLDPNQSGSATATVAGNQNGYAQPGLINQPSNAFERGGWKQDQTTGRITYTNPGWFAQGVYGNPPVETGPTATKVAGTEAIQPEQKLQYGLNLIGKMVDIGGKAQEQFNTQSKPVLDQLQEVDQLAALAKPALAGDGVAAKQFVQGVAKLTGSKDLYSLIGGGKALLTGRPDMNIVQAAIKSMSAYRKPLLDKLANLQQVHSSKISSHNIGGLQINPSMFIAHPYETQTNALIAQKKGAIGFDTDTGKYVDAKGNEVK